MTDVKRKALSRSRSVKSTVCARTLCAKGRSDNAAAPAEPLWGCAVYIRVCRCVARQPGASTTLKPTSTVKRAVYDALLD